MSKKLENGGAPFNPFTGRNPDEVWKEIRADGQNKEALSREEVMRRLQKLAKKAKEKRA